MCKPPSGLCVSHTKKDCLYLGKLAVSPLDRKKGLARRLIEHAETRAVAQGYGKLQLQTRIELTENHLFFQRLGFVKTAETRHHGYDRTTSITMEKRIRGKTQP